MMVGGEEWVTSEDEELERRLHPLLRLDEMSGKKMFKYFCRLCLLSTKSKDFILRNNFRSVTSLKILAW